MAIFMKGTPEMPACGNSLRALQALWNAGAPIAAVDILPDPRLFERGLICRADDRGDPVVQFSPPLVAQQEQFDVIAGILGAC